MIPTSANIVAIHDRAMTANLTQLRESVDLASKRENLEIFVRASHQLNAPPSPLRHPFGRTPSARRSPLQASRGAPGRGAV